MPAGLNVILDTNLLQPAGLNVILDTNLRFPPNLPAAARCHIARPGGRLN
jgi:hypothetical protein